jgi:hypothetical protein
MGHLASWISEILRAPEDEATIKRVAGAVSELTARRPIYA